ncbi:DNA-directed RNA polymerase subunit L [bacterium]|nr:DNA-directed RNA polymerase subunit L [bacterium]
MELKIIKKTKKELEVEIIGEKETLLNPIKQALLQNENVEYAEYFTDHPLLNNYRLFLRIKSGDPMKILLQVTKNLEKEVDHFHKQFNEKSKKGKNK